MNISLAYILAAALMGVFSSETQTNFMTSCSAGASKAVCNCVLQKIESKYAENEFKQMESLLVEGKDASAYMDFLVNARLECNNADKPAGSASGSIIAAAGVVQPKPSQPAPITAPAKTDSSQTGMTLSANDIVVLQALLSNKSFKRNFVEECTDEADDYFGKKQAKNSCQCAYDRLVKDETLLYNIMGATNAKGEVDDFERWGYELISPCLPTQFTPEMEKAFVKECTDDYRGNKKSCKCAFGEIKKNYTVQSMLQSAFTNEEKFQLEMISIVAKCVEF